MRVDNEPGPVERPDRDAEWQVRRRLVELSPSWLEPDDDGTWWGALNQTAEALGTDLRTALKQAILLCRDRRNSLAAATLLRGGLDHGCLMGEGTNSEVLMMLGQSGDGEAVVELWRALSGRSFRISTPLVAKLLKVLAERSQADAVEEVVAMLSPQEATNSFIVASRLYAQAYVGRPEVAKLLYESISDPTEHHVFAMLDAYGAANDGEGLAGFVVDVPSTIRTARVLSRSIQAVVQYCPDATSLVEALLNEFFERDLVVIPQTITPILRQWRDNPRRCLEFVIELEGRGVDVSERNYEQVFEACAYARNADCLSETFEHLYSSTPAPLSAKLVDSIWAAVRRCRNDVVCLEIYNALSAGGQHPSRSHVEVVFWAAVQNGRTELALDLLAQLPAINGSTLAAVINAASSAAKPRYGVDAIVLAAIKGPASVSHELCEKALALHGSPLKESALSSFQSLCGSDNALDAKGLAGKCVLALLVGRATLSMEGQAFGQLALLNRLVGSGRAPWLDQGLSLLVKTVAGSKAAKLIRYEAQLRQWATTVNYELGASVLRELLRAFALSDSYDQARKVFDEIRSASPKSLTAHDYDALYLARVRSGRFDAEDFHEERRQRFGAKITGLGIEGRLLYATRSRNTRNADEAWALATSQGIELSDAAVEFYVRAFRIDTKNLKARPSSSAKQVYGRALTCFEGKPLPANVRAGLVSLFYNASTGVRDRAALAELYLRLFVSGYGIGLGDVPIWLSCLDMPESVRHAIATRVSDQTRRGVSLGDALLTAAGEWFGIHGYVAELSAVGECYPDLKLKVAWKNAICQAKANTGDLDGALEMIAEGRETEVALNFESHRRVVRSLNASNARDVALSQIKGWLDDDGVSLGSARRLFSDVLSSAADADDLVGIDDVTETMAAFSLEPTDLGRARVMAARQRAGLVAAVTTVDASVFGSSLSSVLLDVVHELSNLMGVVDYSVMAAGRWLAKSQPENVNEQLTVAREAINKMARRVDYWRTLSGGEGHVGSSSGDVGDMIANAVDAEIDGITSDAVTVTLPHDQRRRTVAGDRILIDMALRNVIKNALAATSEQSEVGRVRVEVAWVGDAFEGGPFRVEGWVVVRISDSGPGIGEEIREAIFEQGFTQKTERGMGLGLAIASKALSAVGGHIGLDDYEESSGASFSLWLACSTADIEGEDQRDNVEQGN